MGQARRKAEENRSRKDIPSTRNWSLVFQKKIIRELGETGDPLKVAFENRVEVVEVVKCLERQRHKLRRASPGKSDFIETLEATARIGIFMGLEKLAQSDDPKDGAKLADLCRKLLESSGVLGKRKGGDGSTNVTNFNISGEMNMLQVLQQEYMHMSTDQLAERMRKLAGEIEGKAEIVDVVPLEGE